MLVKNTEARVISVGYASKSDAGGQTLQVGEEKVVEQHHVFSPGVNDVPAEKWNELKKHPFVQHKLDEELFVEMEKDLGPSAGKDQVESLADITPKKAVKLVEATVMADLLEKWKGCEKRSDVKKAIEKQLKKLIDVKRRSEEDKDEEGQGDE